MGFVKRSCTTARPETPEGSHKEAELIFYHEIVSMVDKYSNADSLVINIDQTPIKYAPASSRTMTSKNSKHVTGFTNKQAITGILGISLSANFLHEQLKYGRKTA